MMDCPADMKKEVDTNLLKSLIKKMYGMMFEGKGEEPMPVADAIEEAAEPESIADAMAPEMSEEEMPKRKPKTKKIFGMAMMSAKPMGKGKYGKNIG